MKDFLNNIVESIETVIDNIPDQPIDQSMENITIDMLQVCPIDDHLTIGVQQIMSDITILQI